MGLTARFRRVASFDGTQLAWTARGTGAPAVIFANGIVCTDTYWTYLYPYLARRGHRVVFWDYRGHGRSEPPADPGEITLTSHARDLWAVADTAGVERAVLIGHSMGVQTILEAFRSAPQRVAGLVAIAGPYENPAKTFLGGPLWEYVLPVLELSMLPSPPVTRAVWRSLTGQGDLMTWSGRTGGLIGSQAPPELMAEYFAHLNQIDPLLAMRMAKAMAAHSAKDLLPEIDVPALILAGGKDIMTPPRLAEEMAEAMPRARLEILPEGSHTLPIDDPKWVNTQVAAFLRELA